MKNQVVLVLGVLVSVCGNFAYSPVSKADDAEIQTFLGGYSAIAATICFYYPASPCGVAIATVASALSVVVIKENRLEQVAMLAGDAHEYLVSGHLSPALADIIESVRLELGNSEDLEMKDLSTKAIAAAILLQR